jgi:hypothetical protein
MPKPRSVSPLRAPCVASLEASIQQAEELRTLRQDRVQTSQVRNHLISILETIHSALVERWQNDGAYAR